MARAPNPDPEEIERSIIAKAKPGKTVHVGDTQNLYIKMSPKKGNLSWIYRHINPDTGKMTTKSMGPYPEVSLEVAKNSAAYARKIIKVDKKNPFDPVVDTTEGRTTYGEVARAWIDNQKEKFKKPKPRRAVEILLLVYCKPLLDKPILKINAQQIHDTLRPWWDDSPTRRGSPWQVIRALALLTKVFARAKTLKRYFHENPALWEGVQQNLFPPIPESNESPPAMHYDDVPEFFAKLYQSADERAPSLMFLILTATRPEETRGMLWSEVVDFETKQLWTIPGSRMKKGREHRVPLSAPAIEILKRQRQKHHNSKFVFPASRGERDKPQEEKAMRRLMQKMGICDVTPHRFRSSFRDWAGDKTDFARETIEECLAHRIGSKTERAYRRLDAFEKRKKLMAKWAAYLTRNVILSGLIASVEPPKPPNPVNHTSP
jgi:integrase